MLNLFNFKRIKFYLNIFLATLFYERRRDISQQIWGSRNYQMTSYFVSRQLRFNSQATAIVQFQLKILSLLRSYINSH